MQSNSILECNQAKYIVQQMSMAGGETKSKPIVNTYMQSFCLKNWNTSSNFILLYFIIKQEMKHQMQVPITATAFPLCTATDRRYFNKLFTIVKY